ncbi:nascent polypeptide-associated complex subunit alpha isoform X4 [Leopardus geoffroyi]|uniref:nascent polypeptide-associated complex subunit alpha isoform X4 n=1 Tax=Leopardus geoffroyi TaxID=46844 RepID=UPI001E25FB39|nr:nascent polypeptide-associated complex subunit alpha isoform X4 [Leopardus geoffroyi]
MLKRFLKPPKESVQVSRRSSNERSKWIANICKNLVTIPVREQPEGSLVKGSDWRLLLTRNRILVPPPPPGFLLQQAWVTLSLALFLPPSWFRVPRTKCLVKPQKPSLLQSRSCHSPRLRQGLEQNRTVMNQYQSLRNRIPHRQPPNKPSWQQQLKLMKNQSVKQNRAGVKRRHGRLCPN